MDRDLALAAVELMAVADGRRRPGGHGQRAVVDLYQFAGDGSPAHPVVRPVVIEERPPRTGT